TQVNQKDATLIVKHQGNQVLEWDGMKWARKFISDTRQGSAPKKAGDILAVGEVIFVRQANAEAENVQWHLSQVPSANTAFIAMNPENGAIISLVGGFNFEHNK
ncbi:hypothetical protein AKJ18_35445, partial [Vibrio xuii]